MSYLGYERDWNIDNQFSTQEDYDQFIEACIAGDVRLSVSSNKTDVLLCAQPKSASLYFHHLLSRALRLKQFEIGFSFSGGDFYFPRILSAKFNRENTVSHCHCDGSNAMSVILKNLNLRTIVLTRTLVDALVSRRDMLIKDGIGGSLPSYFTPDALERFLAADASYQLNVIIDIFASIFIRFYVSWMSQKNDPDLALMFVTYHEILADLPQLIMRISKWLEMEVTHEHILHTIEEIARFGGVNFNKGVTGRGRKLLSIEQIGRLKTIAAALGCHDEEFLGFAV